MMLWDHGPGRAPLPLLVRSLSWPARHVGPFPSYQDLGTLPVFADHARSSHHFRNPMGRRSTQSADWAGREVDPWWVKHKSDRISPIGVLRSDLCDWRVMRSGMSGSSTRGCRDPCINVLHEATVRARQLCAAFAHSTSFWDCPEPGQSQNDVK